MGFNTDGLTQRLSLLLFFYVGCCMAKLLSFVELWIVSRSQVHTGGGGVIMTEIHEGHEGHERGGGEVGNTNRH